MQPERRQPPRNLKEEEEEKLWEAQDGGSRRSESRVIGQRA